jgi:hypothetical protein
MMEYETAWPRFSPQAVKTTNTNHPQWFTNNIQKWV